MNIGLLWLCLMAVVIAGVFNTCSINEIAKFHRITLESDKSIVSFMEATNKRIKLLEAHR